MRKEVLYLHGEYCPNVESLKDMINWYYGEDDFREELLTYNSDGVLQRWLDERNAGVELKGMYNLSDLECFKSLYQSIVGKPCDFHLECDFFKYAELVRVEIDRNSFPIQSGGSIFTADGKQVAFVFKPKKLGNERFVFVLMAEDDGMMQEVTFHPENINQEFSITFQLKDTKKNREVRLAVRQDGKDSVLCTIQFGNVKLRHRFNDHCYLLLYRLKNHPSVFMTEVIKKDRQQLKRIFGEEFEISSNLLTNGIYWDSSDFGQYDVVRILEDFIWKNYSYQFQFPSNTEIEDFLVSGMEQYRGCAFVRSRTFGDYLSNTRANAGSVTCFSIEEKNIRECV